MSRAAVEAVVINWKRPDNVAKIVEALRAQSVACTITICDCHPEPCFGLPKETLESADRVYRWTHNLGPFSRYGPCAAYDHEFTYLADDDLVPGSRCLEHFLDHTSARPFGVLGQVGRRLKPDMVYRPRDIGRSERFEEVDLIVQAYFVRTCYLGHIATVRWELHQQGVVGTEDDILLAVAMQTKAGLPSLLTPGSNDPETSVMREMLAQPFACSARSDHLRRRTALFAQARSIGWRPLGSRRETPLVWALRGALLSAEKRVRAWRDLYVRQEP